MARYYIPSKHESFTQCRFNVGPSSSPLAQPWNSIGWMSRVWWDSAASCGSSALFHRTWYFFWTALPPLPLLLSLLLLLLLPVSLLLHFPLLLALYLIEAAGKQLRLLSLELGCTGPVLYRCCNCCGWLLIPLPLPLLLLLLPLPLLLLPLLLVSGAATVYRTGYPPRSGIFRSFMELANVRLFFSTTVFARKYSQEVDGSNTPASRIIKAPGSAFKSP